jgi:RimJ/RimL family protein N-acetyltransferase
MSAIALTDIETRRVASVPEQDLAALAGSHLYGRHCEDVSLQLADSQRYLLHQMRNALTGTSGAECVQALNAKGETLGLILFRLSPWDTDHFGYRCGVIDWIVIRENDYALRTSIARALLSHFEKWMKEEKIRFASCRTSALDLAVVNSFERVGFDLIESYVYNYFDTRSLPDERQPALRLAVPADEDIMRVCSVGAFDTQRFHADPRVAKDKATSLYDNWIRTSFRDPKTRTLVLEENGAPVAFMTYFDSDLTEFFGCKFAMWKMALINPEYRGKGIGTRFFRALVHHHREEGLQIVDSGVSMRNLASINLHNKAGFKIVSTQLTFHKWS